MSIHDALYGHVDIWVWVLAGIAAVLAVACWWVLRDRDVIARDLSYTRAELRRLRMQWTQSRKPAMTLVLPALPADPEEFRKTQLRRVR